MTLLVGVLAEGGVIIGADSAATMGAAGLQTIRQATATKVEVVRGQALVAVSGPVGLGQRLTAAVEEYVRTVQRANDPPVRVMTELRQRFAPIINSEWEAAAQAQPVLGRGVVLPSVMSHSLVALCAAGVPTLIQFDQQGAPEHATSALPFVCAGSGMANADPLMGFFRDVFLPTGQLPTLADATFVAVWTLLEAIELAPAYVSGPIHFYVLEPGNGGCVARELAPEELEEHKQMCHDARDHLASFRTQPVAAPPPPEPPPVA
jgi:hypothetical protein